MFKLDELTANRGFRFGRKTANAASRIEHAADRSKPSSIADRGQQISRADAHVEDFLTDSLRQDIKCLLLFRRKLSQASTTQVNLRGEWFQTDPAG